MSDQKTDKEKIKSLENLLTKKIEDLYSLSLYDDLDPENFNDDIDKKIHSAYKKQLDRLSINLSISYFLVAFVIGVNSFIIYHFFHFDGIWIPCILMIGYFWYSGRKREIEEKNKCLNRLKELTELTLSYHQLLHTIREGLRAGQKEEEEEPTEIE
ncbi:MAG: hypothetical protein CL824_00645 [Crocinitomicaceae bacterium]|nr:hypothetical protein [Crocinitomicaceae bacterium]